MKKLCAAFLASILVALSPGSGALAAVARAPRASAPAAVPAVGALGGELGSAPMSAAFGDGLLAAPGFGLTSDGSIGPEGLTVAAPQDAAFTLVMPTGQPFPQTQATSIVSPEALAPAALSGPETYASVSASNVRAAAPETPLAAAMEPLRTLAHAVADGAARFSGLGRQFDGSRAHDGDAAPEAEQAVEAAIPEKPLPGTGENGRESLQESAQGLFRLRHDVQVDAREILKENLGGDFGDGILHRDVGRVLRRLLAAAGYPREAAQVFIGNSFLPNAFTTVVPSEGKFLSENASVARVFRIANIFVSLGLLRSMENESQLAFVLAHELMHNWKGHLKDFSGAGHVFLGHFHELEADAEALKLVAAAGYDAHQAIDSLYALHREYDRLEREYALLKQDKSELTQALSRLRDIHPHPDIRRANMLDHMNEALEQYKPQPVPADPIWMRRRQAEERPSNLDRLGRRLEKAAEGKTIEEAIFDLEVFIEREMEHGELAYEGWAVVEEAYRRLVRRAQNPEDLRPIEVSIRRQEDYSGGFPSRRLKSDLITRQLDMTLAKIARMSPKAAAAPAKAQVPHIAGREQLALAFQTASALSFEEKDRASFGAAQSAAVKLWRAARTVLAAELGREPVPEEIEAELTRGLPAAWAKPIRLASDADPVNRELAPILRALGPSATLADFVAAAEGRSEKARRAGILWSLDRVRDRDGLKAALKAVSALPGLERLERGPNTAFALDASHRLWRAARRALSQEPEADRSPEKIRALLVAGLPAAWRAVVERAGAREKRLPPPSPVAGREAPGLNDFLGSSARLGHESRLAGTLRLLGSIHDRSTLDAAFQTLSREAENLGLDLQQVAMEDMYGGGSVAELVLRVASQLWRGTRTVLTRELGRPALPEEIIDELRKKLSPTWMRSYREGFHVEVLESAFGPEQFRSKTLRPSELVMRLHGRQDSYKQEEHWKKGRKIPGFEHWTLRHYSPPIGGVINGKPVFRYERYYLSGLSSPRLEDQLDILWTFDAGEAPSPAMISLLRREGKLDAFLQTALAELGAEFSRRIAGAANLAERRKHLSWYEDWVTQLLGRALYGVRDFGEIRRNVESIWEPVSALMDSKEVVEAYKDSTHKADSIRTADSTRSHMADQFFQVMSIALRQAVIATDMAGARPEREELAKTAELVARIEKTLRPFPSQALVVAHARNLDRHLGSEQGYMKAYHWAIKNAVVVKEGSRFERWLKGHHNWFMTPVAQLIKFFYYSWKWAWGVASKLWRQRTLPGIPVEHMRSLLSQDFVHFMGLVGDPATDVRTKLMAVALLDRIDVGYDLGEDVFGRDVKMRAAASVGRWLLEDVSAEAKDSDLPGIASGMLKITDRHPGLLQPDLETKGTLENAFRTGAEFIKRNEAYRSLAKGEHPFRAVNTRWALAFAARLDATKAWPKGFDDRLDLLDFLDSNGEFNDELDRRILTEARDDEKAFRAWVARDRERLARLEGGLVDNGFGLQRIDGSDNVVTPFGQVPIPRVQPLKVVRNPALRTELFDRLPESHFKEKPPRRSLSEWWKGYVRLWKAYRAAREYFSREFLDGLRDEGTMEDKIFDVLEEVDRVAAERAKAAEKRWEKGDFTKEDREFLAEQGIDDPEKEWKPKLAHEKEDILHEYKGMIRGRAMGKLLELYNAFAGVQEPLLGMILDNYPEPTRSRDALLERLIKARRLKGGQLTYLESHKSYRQPNPVRIAEKHFLDQMVIQMRKFSPAEKVDILLHVAKVERLSRERISVFNRRILSGDRRKLARDYASLKSVAQLENYMSLMHPKDRALLVKALFYGEHSLNDSPDEVRRLYERMVIEKRGLPPFLEKVMRRYFDVLTPDERATLLSELAGQDQIGAALKGPQVVKVALKTGGVTGAKIAQALATHRGLIGEEYAAELEDFKDKAQEMVKMRAHGLISERIAAVARALPEGLPAPARSVFVRAWNAWMEVWDRLLGRAKERKAGLSVFTAEELEAISYEALPKKNTARKLNDAARRRLVRQVRFLLKEQGRRMRWIEEMGPELGAGSIKLVYKIGLDDGRVWVAKIRAPGAAYRVSREFEMIDQLIKEMELRGDLDLPAARQLLDEVKAMVRAEMDFRDEAAKERAMLERVESRPWYARLLTARPYIPRPHPVLVSEDFMVEEFVTTRRFADLPSWSPFGPSKRSIARAAVDEGMFGLVFDEWLEPDPHTGNRHARWGGLYRFFSRLVVMDLGQGAPHPIERLKPLMRAALALQAGDVPAAAQRLYAIANRDVKQEEAKVLESLAKGIALRPEAGLIERLMDGLLEAEKLGVLVKPEYAALEKAMILYTGYSDYLPKDYILRSLERATVARLMRDGKLSAWGAVKLWFTRLFLGSAATRAELERLIEAL